MIAVGYDGEAKSNHQQQKKFVVTRDVAQLGSAFEWGSKGRKFESCRPDHY
jgi:hypothetical protein